MWGGHGIMSSPSKKVGYTSPVSPTKLRPWSSPKRRRQIDSFQDTLGWCFPTVLWKTGKQPNYVEK